MNTQETKLRFRPRFRESVNLSQEQIKDNIKDMLQQNPELCKGEIVDYHIILKIPKNQQHYWSPQLTLELESEENKTLIRGLFGPKPNVWTMFVFFYSAIGFLTMLGLIFGLSQMMLKMNAYGLWAVPVGLFLMLALFLISKAGQKLGKEQMIQLKELLNSALSKN